MLAPPVAEFADPTAALRLTLAITRVTRATHPAVDTETLLETGLDCVVPARHPLGRGISAKRFEPAIPFVYGVMYPSYRPRSRLAIEFVALVRDHLAGNPLLTI